MSNNDIVKLPILEPLASYFGTLYKFKPDGNPGNVKINFETPEPNDIFWKMYANTKCYPKDSNKDSSDGDIAHQFTRSVVGLAKNLGEIDPSSTTGTIQEYLVNKIDDSIKRFVTDKLNNNNNIKDYFIFKKFVDNSYDVTLKNNYLQEIINNLLLDFDEVIDSSTDCDNFKQSLLTIKSNDFISNKYVESWSINMYNEYYSKLLKEKLESFINKITNNCFRRNYKFISNLTKENKKKVLDTITMIQNRNDALLLFNKYFELKDMKNKKIDDYNNLDNFNDLRINLIKQDNGNVILFQDLPYIDIQSGVGGIFISSEEKTYTNLIKIANDCYRNYNKLIITTNNNPLEYTNDVCKNYKPLNNSSNYASVDVNNLKLRGALNTVFNIPAIKNLLQNWLRTELSSSSMYITPSSYRVFTTKKERDDFEKGLVDEEKEMEKIIKDLPMNEWVKRGSVYYKRETDGKETRYNLDNENEFNGTCLSIGATADNCVKVLTKAVSGNLEELKELLKDDNFVNALINPDLVKQLPPQIALKLLKTFGFKKTVIPSAKGPIFIIEPIEGWLSRLSKTTNGIELVRIINSNPKFMTLIRFLVGIVHQNPTIIGNNPSVVIPRQPIPTRNIVARPVNYRTWPSIPPTPSAKTTEPVLSLEEIKKGLKPLNSFYKGLNLSNTPFGLSNFNPALTRLLSYLQYNGNGLGLYGGGNSRVVAKVQVGLGLNFADEFNRVYEIIKKKLGSNLPGKIDEDISIQLRAFSDLEKTLLEELNKLQKLSTLKELGLLEGVIGNENYIDDNLKDYQNKIDNYMKNRKKTDNTLKTLMKMYQHLLPANLLDIRI